MSDLITSRPTEADRLFHTTMALDLVLSEVDRLTAELDAVTHSSFTARIALNGLTEITCPLSTLRTINTIVAELAHLDQLVVDMLGDGSTKGGH